MARRHAPRESPERAARNLSRRRPASLGVTFQVERFRAVNLKRVGDGLQSNGVEDPSVRNSRIHELRSMSAAEGHEIALLRRVGRGEAEALRALYETQGPRLFAVALRVVRARADAEEVVQETFLEVWRRARDYDAGRGSPLAWMVTICRTRAIDRLRARGSQERIAQLALATPPPGASASPSDAAEVGQLQARVQVALRDLPAEQRRVLELAYFEGLSQSEIAKETGDALGTVKTRVRLGMEKLAGLLPELWDRSRS